MKRNYYYLQVQQYHHCQLQQQQQHDDDNESSSSSSSRSPRSVVEFCRLSCPPPETAVKEPRFPDPQQQQHHHHHYQQQQHQHQHSLRIPETYLVSVHEIKPVQAIIDDTVTSFWAEIDRLAAMRPSA